MARWPIWRGLNDPDDIVTGHFRRCSDLWKEQSTSIHPLIEELLNVSGKSEASVAI